MTNEELNELYESSKRDDTIFVGSQIRQLVGEIQRLRQAVRKIPDPQEPNEMNERERAVEAAKCLNSGDKWRCCNVTADWPQYKKQGRWLLDDSGVEQWYVTHAELIELAKREGWKG